MPASVRTPSTSIASSRTRRSLACKFGTSRLRASVLPRGIARPCLVGRHHLFELLRDHFGIAALRQRIQFPKTAVVFAGFGDHPAHRPLDLLVRGWLNTLVPVKEFLIHLFARTESGKDDLDVLIRDMPRQQD